MVLIRIASVLLMVLVTSCSSLSVMSDYDQAYDFTRNRTYRWGKIKQSDSSNVLATNSLVRKRVQSAVEQQLTLRGFVPALHPSRADLVVDLRAYVRERGMVRYEDPFFYPSVFYRGGFYRYYTWFGLFGREPIYYRYNEGSLLIEIFDARSRQLVWNGAASGVLRQYCTGEALQKDIDLAVSKIFSDFPVPGSVK